MPPSTLSPDPGPVGTRWSHRVLDEVDSTNTFAARLPPWTAIRAITQTRGRGRTPDRRWVSDVGGLWLSAVVPCPGPRANWETLPLAAGWAVTNAIRRLGVTGVRLRWPNDVMVGPAKLAGVLVERYTAETAVIGVGINVNNAPERADAALRHQTTRLSDLISAPCTVDNVAKLVLAEFRTAVTLMAQSGFPRIAGELNAAWEDPRPVEVTFRRNPAPTAGMFHGIDALGRLRLTLTDGSSAVFAAHEVALFRERTGSGSVPAGCTDANAATSLPI